MYPHQSGTVCNGHLLLSWSGASHVFSCASNPCRNGGNCVQLVGSYICTCQAGFTGDNCENGNFRFLPLSFLRLGTSEAKIKVSLVLTKPRAAKGFTFCDRSQNIVIGYKWMLRLLWGILPKFLTSRFIQLQLVLLV